MDAQISVEETLDRAVAAGLLTRLEAGELHRRLGLLAFNMTVAGYSGDLPKSVAAHWLSTLQRNGLGTLPAAAPSRKRARAARWWEQGVTAGVLVERDDSIAFVDRAVQDDCSLHYCRTHPLTPMLLRLAARASFRDIWRRWAEADPMLADQLMLLLLRDEQGGEGQSVARALRYLGDMRAVDALIGALQDTSDGPCIRAALALCALGDARAVEPLAKRVMQEQRLSLKVPFIEALGTFGPPAIPTLTALLKHPHLNVRLASIRGLGRTNTPDAVLTLISILFGKGAHTMDEHLLMETMAQAIQSTDALVMRRMDAQSSGESPAPSARREEAEEARALAARVAGYSQDPRRAQEAVRALGRLGEPAIPALVAALSHNNHRVRGYLAQALSQTHSCRAVGPLLDQLKLEVSLAAPSAADAVGFALVEVHCPESADVLADALAEPNAVVRSYVACALAELGDTRAAEPLLALLQEHEPRIRARAARWLGKLGDRRAVEPLIQVLGTPVSIPSPPLRPDGPPGKLDLTQVLAQVESIHGPERQVPRQAAEALGELGDARAVGPLIQALSDPDEFLRSAAAVALGTIGDPLAIAPLVQALADDSQMVRVSAAAALAQLHAIEVLLAVIQERGTGTPPEVMRALYMAKDKRAVQPLLVLLRALLPVKTTEAAALAHSLIWALDALADPRALEPLLTLVREGNSFTTFDAARVLGRLGDQQTLVTLRDLQPQYPTSTVAGRSISFAIADLSRRLAKRQAGSSQARA